MAVSLEADSEDGSVYNDDQTGTSTYHYSSRGVQNYNDNVKKYLVIGLALPETMRKRKLKNPMPMSSAVGTYSHPARLVEMRDTDPLTFVVGIEGSCK